MFSKTIAFDASQLSAGARLLLLEALAGVSKKTVCTWVEVGPAKADVRVAGGNLSECDSAPGVFAVFSVLVVNSTGRAVADAQRFYLRAPFTDAELRDVLDLVAVAALAVRASLCQRSHLDARSSATRYRVVRRVPLPAPISTPLHWRGLVLLAERALTIGELSRSSGLSVDESIHFIQELARLDALDNSISTGMPPAEIFRKLSIFESSWNSSKSGGMSKIARHRRIARLVEAAARYLVAPFSLLRKLN